MVIETPFLQGCAQSLHGCVEPRFHGSDRDVLDRCDLVQRQVGEESQGDTLPEIRRELGQGLAQGRIGRVGRCLGDIIRSKFLQSVEDAEACTPPSAVIPASVQDDAVEPRQQRRLGWDT